MHRIFAIVFSALVIGLLSTPAAHAQEADTTVESAQQALLNAQLRALNQEVNTLKDATEVRLDAQDSDIHEAKASLIARVDALNKRIDDLNRVVTQHAASSDSGSAGMAALLILIALGAATAAYFGAVWRIRAIMPPALSSDRAEYAVSQVTQPQDSENGRMPEMPLVEIQAEAIEDYEQKTPGAATAVPGESPRLSPHPVHSLTQQAPSDPAAVAVAQEEAEGFSASRQALAIPPIEDEAPLEKTDGGLETTLTIDDYFNCGLAEYSEKRYDAALIAFDRALELASDFESNITRHIQLLAAKSATLYQLGDYKKNIEVCQFLINRFESDFTPAIREIVARMYFSKGLALDRLGQLQEAADTYQVLIGHFGQDQNPEIHKIVAKAFINKGVALRKCESAEPPPPAKMAAVPATESRVPPSPEAASPPTLAPPLATRAQMIAAASSQDARELLEKAIALNDQGRTEAAIGAFQTLIEQFGQDRTPVVREQIAKAILYKGIALSKVNRPEEAITSFQVLIDQFGQEERGIIQEQVSEAIFQKGLAYNQLGQHEAGIETFQELTEQFEYNQIPAIREIVAKALLHRGATLGRLNRPEAAVGSFQTLIDHFGQERSPVIRESIAKALYNKATALNQVYWYEEAIETYETLIARFGQETTPSIQALITPARIAAAYIRIPLAKRDWEQAIVANERLNAAIVDLRQVIEQCDDDESRISITGRLGYALFLIGRNDEAATMIRQSLQLGGKMAFEAQQEDTQIWRLEVEDNEYDQLLASTWAELYPEEYY